MSAMKLQENVSLKPYNTFGVEAKTRFFVEVTTGVELLEALGWVGDRPLLILGGGSNLLFPQDWEGVVLKINIRGREIVQENTDSVHIKFSAGENWHESVLYTVNQGWGGLENLSLIPGQVGTAPVQNIGAYGAEVKDTIVSLEAVNINKRTTKVFKNEECKFGYRDSIFKHQQKGQWIITSVTFELNKNPVLKLNYGAIGETLRAQNVENPGVKDVSEAVIKIRQSKLPDPNKIGNGGSFFKNPIVSAEKLEALKKNYPDIPNYHLLTTDYKIPAAWLIETAGWKGKRVGNAGVHEKQALVLVNHGGATGSEIWQLGQQVQADVETKFGIKLEPEVNII